jgi:hypothetical protein
MSRQPSVKWEWWRLVWPPTEPATQGWPRKEVNAISSPDWGDYVQYGTFVTRQQIAAEMAALMKAFLRNFTPS